MRRVALTILVASCQPTDMHERLERPEVKPLPDAAVVDAPAIDARVQLDAAVTYALRPRPPVALLAEPPLAWRAFWPLDRAMPELAPYLPEAARLLSSATAAHLAGDKRRAAAACKTALSHGANLRAYLLAWCTFFVDQTRGIAAISTLGAKAKSRRVREAAQQDELEVLAATTNPDSAARWVSRLGALQGLAAEYARQGKTAEAIELYTTLGTGGNDEQACELRLNKLRLKYTGEGDAYTLARFAYENGLEDCGEGALGLACEQGLQQLEFPLSCREYNLLDRERIHTLWMALDGWATARDGVRVAQVAMAAEPLPGWDIVARDSLYNALAASGCSAAAVSAVAAAARRAVLDGSRDPELRTFASLDTGPDVDCLALLQPAP